MILGAFDDGYDDFIDTQVAVGIDTEQDVPATFNEVVGATMSFGMREGVSHARIKAISPYIEERRKNYEALTGKSGSHFYALASTNATMRGRWDALIESNDIYRDPNGRLQYTKKANNWMIGQERAVNALLDLKQFSQTHPDQFKTDEQIMEAIETDFAKKRDYDMSFIKRSRGVSGVAAELLGSAGFAMTDPIILATLPLGAGAIQGTRIGANFLKAFTTEAAIATAAEIPVQSEVFDFKREIKSPYSLKEAAFNVLAAGVGAGLIRGAGSVTVDVAQAALKKYRTAKVKGEVRGTDEEQLAESTLETYTREAEQTPMATRSVETDEAHFDAIDKAFADIESGQPVNVRGLVEHFENIPDDAPDMPDSFISSTVEEMQKTVDDATINRAFDEQEKQLQELIEANKLSRGERKALNQEKVNLEHDKKELQEVTASKNAAKINTRKRELMAQGMAAQRAKQQARAEAEQARSVEIGGMDEKLTQINNRLRKGYEAAEAEKYLPKIKSARKKMKAAPAKKVPRETKKPAEPAVEPLPSVQRVPEASELSKSRSDMDLYDQEGANTDITEARLLLDESDMEIPERIIKEQGEDVVETRSAREAMDELDQQQSALDELITCKVG